MSNCRHCGYQDYRHHPNCINASEVDNSWTDHKTHGTTPRPRIRESEGRYIKEKKSNGEGQRIE